MHIIPFQGKDVRLYFLLSLLISSVFADYNAKPIDTHLIDSHIKIIDIRTPYEWKTTGIIKGSIPIMFFNEQGNYNLSLFLSELNKHVAKGEKFAVICNSGNRSQVLGKYLGQQLNYDVIDLQGGIQSAIQKKIPLIPYSK